MKNDMGKDEREKAAKEIAALLTGADEDALLFIRSFLRTARTAGGYEGGLGI